MKKVLLIGLVVVFGLVSIPFIFIKLAFGPLHDSVTIDLGQEGELLCDETYNADFADEFYDVKMILKTLEGREHDFGDVTFHDQDWNKRISTTRIGDWLIIPLQLEKFVHIKMLNTVTGQLNDTTFQPFDLRKDLLYKEKFKDKPDHLYRGSSRIDAISGSVIEISYEYKAKAEYPTEILVSQKLVYEISPGDGKIMTKEIRDRVIQ